jgi:hypothetical protein
LSLVVVVRGVVLPSMYTFTDALYSVVPESVRVVSLVIKSVLLVPVSVDPNENKDGGAVVSIVTVYSFEAAPVFPAISVILALKV